VSFKIEAAQRVQRLPPSYVFDALAKRKREARGKGLDIIDLGIGDPDYGRPEAIREEISQEVHDHSNDRYPDTEGLVEYRQAWADLYRRDWGVELDPKCEVHHLIGGKEGIGHIPLALVNPGDIVLIPTPAYPVYLDGTILAHGTPVPLPLTMGTGFLPDFRAVASELAELAKVVWINSPHNPTGSVASLDYFEQLVDWAIRHKTIVLSDATYSHINSSGKPTPSILQVPKAKEVAAEFHSVSKMFSATGDRCGVIVGNQDIIAALHRVKASIDSGGSNFVQEAYAKHLLTSDQYIRALNAWYDVLREEAKKVLKGLGITFLDSGATFYLWSKTPDGFDSDEQFVHDLLDATGIVCTPGSGFGEAGGGYFRISLAATNIERIQEMGSRLQKFLAR
jgi:LL-diaminopimelate aminotransferase